jgi:hypothetical protein
MSRRSLLVIFVVVLASVIPAAAAGPVRFPLDFTSGPFPLASCGSFDVLEIRGFSNVEENVDVTTQARSQHGLAFSINLSQRGKLYVSRKDQLQAVHYAAASSFFDEGTAPLSRRSSTISCSTSFHSRLSSIASASEQHCAALSQSMLIRSSKPMTHNLGWRS